MKQAQKFRKNIMKFVFLIEVGIEKSLKKQYLSALKWLLFQMGF